MARIGLATYLMLVTLAGPGFCPCSFALSVPRIAHSGPAQPTRLASRQSCCRLPLGEKIPINPRPTDCPFCPGHECPFREHESRVVLDSECAGKLRPHAAAGLEEMMPLPSAAAWRPGTGAIQIPESRLALPFLTGRDILHALQVLRL